MVSAIVKKALDAGLQSGIPQGGQTISSWAEQYRYVSAQRSARPGKWSNDVFPFLRGIMDSVTEPDVRKVVLMKSSQVGGTEALLNILCYYIHQDPSLMMYVAEIEDKAKAWKQEAFDPTIAESPEIRRCMMDLAHGSSDNNQKIVRFRGGQLTIGWASSPAQLSSRPARIVCFDEVDAFEATKEGDAVKLAEARTKTFQESRKVILNSSPRDKENSIIEREYLAGDQREFYVPCPECGFYQTLKWSNVRWDEPDTASEAYYICGIIDADSKLIDGCGMVIEHDEKTEMLERGIWRAGSGFKGTASFRINELYSPMTTWGDMAVDFLEAKKHPDTLRVWTNTRMGETFAVDGEKIEYGNLTLQREVYETEVPQGVEFLTAGVDVQGDRLEMEVRGWGRDLENWLIDYNVIEGSPSMPAVWDDLTDYLTKDWLGIDGREYRISAACIDSGGHHTDEVYDFTHRHKGRRWFAIKGASAAGNAAVRRSTVTGRAKRVKRTIFIVGTDTLKDQIFGFLQNTEPGPGYCHFPESDVCGDSYLKMLCSERKVSRFRMGKQTFVYEKVTANARNEALDCFVYSSAAREIIFPRSKQPRRRGLPAPAEQADGHIVDAHEMEQNDPPPTEPPPNNVIPIGRRRKWGIKKSRYSGYKV
jgi:phage terminase large subunit GpA-like protein